MKRCNNYSRERFVSSVPYRTAKYLASDVGFLQNRIIDEV